MTRDQNVKVSFIAAHQPPLKAGNYRLEVTQKISSDAPEKEDGRGNPTVTNVASFDPLKREQSFTIAGERFSIKPKDIAAIYPPADSEGDHAFVLPHAILARSTLPWEREAAAGDALTPWLAVLLFDADEAPAPTVVAATALAHTDAYFPLDAARLEPGQEHERATVIDVPAATLARIAPAKRDLRLLAHVRRSGVREQAVVLGNRIGRRGAALSAHLVSLEHHYDAQGLIMTGLREGHAAIRLVSLKTWRYQCLDETAYVITERALEKAGLKKERKTLEALLDREIVGEAASFDAAVLAIDGGLDKAKLARLRTASIKHRLNFKSLLLDASRDLVRLPEAAAGSCPVARRYVLAGYAPLPHRLRTGTGVTASWYRGPLTSGAPRLISGVISKLLPACSSDDLLLDHRDVDPPMLDVSYAAAWELGRLLTIRSKTASLALFHWKRAQVQSVHQARDDLDKLAFGDFLKEPDLPRAVMGWFYDLALLKGVPFSYLIADERMLPRESIRFFQIDRGWVECLLDGAFSIGRVTAGDHGHDKRLMRAKGHKARKLARDLETDRPLPSGTMSGVLIRSDVIAGWPDLQIEGYTRAQANLGAGAAENRAACVRMEKLSSHVLICLFDQPVKMIDIHQKPEVLHAGVSEPDDRHPWLYKVPRTLDNKDEAALGREISGTVIPARKPGQDGERIVDDDTRCLRIDTLETLFADALGRDAGNFTAADFAIEMIEGSSKVRFTLAG